MKIPPTARRDAVSRVRRAVPSESTPRNLELRLNCNNLRSLSRRGEYFGSWVDKKSHGEISTQFKLALTECVRALMTGALALATQNAVYLRADTLRHSKYGTGCDSISWVMIWNQGCRFVVILRASRMSIAQSVNPGCTVRGDLFSECALVPHSTLHWI